MTERRLRAGFTLIEILMVLAIVAIFASFTYLNFGGASASGRDAQRQADLRALQNAVEQYRAVNGQYPLGCNTTGSANGNFGNTSDVEWSGQLGSSFECSGGTGQYVVGLAPEFIPVLPIDPQPVSGDQGYVYIVNDDRTVYKIMALNTVESDVVTDENEFARCPVSGASFINAEDELRAGNWCAVYPAHSSNNSNANRPAVCAEADASYSRTYAVWGGISEDTARRSSISGTPCNQPPHNPTTLDSINNPYVLPNGRYEWCASHIAEPTNEIMCL